MRKSSLNQELIKKESNCVTDFLGSPELCFSVTEPDGAIGIKFSFLHSLPAHPAPAALPQNLILLYHATGRQSWVSQSH